jgi:hypothetical protein
MEMMPKFKKLYNENIKNNLIHHINKARPIEPFDILKLRYQYHLSYLDISNYIGYENIYIIKNIVDSIILAMSDRREKILQIEFNYLDNETLFSYVPDECDSYYDRYIKPKELPFPENLFKEIGIDYDTNNKLLAQYYFYFLNKNLSKRYVHCLIMRFLNNYTYSKIADKLNISNGRAYEIVQNAIHNARHILNFREISSISKLRYIGIEELNIPTEAFQKLTMAGIDSIHDLIHVTYYDLKYDIGITDAEIDCIVNDLIGYGLAVNSKYKNEKDVIV